MNLKCVIVDDEPLARNLLQEYVRKVPFLDLVHACSNPLDAIELIRVEKIDLLFLDIHMPEISGISFLKILQNKPLVILTTAFSQYALESYDLDVVDYLLKPITFERFLKGVEKASQRAGNSSQTPFVKHDPPSTPPFIFVKEGTKLVKILLDDILYIEGLKDYVSIYTRKQKIVTLQRLKALEEQLPDNLFIRIHHSYILSLSAVDAIHKEKVQIGEIYLPISDSYKKQFKDFINKNQIQPE